MGKFLLTDLGIVCLVFWSVIGAFLTWYIWKLKEFNLSQDIYQEPEDEGNEKGPLLLEAFREGESDSLSDDPEAVHPDYSA